MNPEEQTVTWLISLGVLNSPKKNIADPEEFLKTSLKDGVVLCKLMDRLLPGSIQKYCQEPRNEADCIANIREFLKGCASLKIEGFEPENLYTGENFSQILSTLLAVNYATQDLVVERPCPRTTCPAASQSSSSLSALKSTKSQPELSVPCVSPQDMAENSGGATQLVVKARFNFKQNNEDELSFNKGELINVTRQEEGGWWEGTLNGKTGWFPSNYVREVKPSEKPMSPKAAKGFDLPQLTKNYYGVVSEATEVHSRLCTNNTTLRKVAALLGNLEDILSFQQGFCVALEECAKMPEAQQRLGGCYLNLMCQIKPLYLNYCSGHPAAVSVLTDHSEELDRFMESQGASSPGILMLTTGLSKPFMRLEKYATLLQELERHVEEAHPDYSDILKATTAFKNLVAQCQDLRKRKNLERQILSEAVRGWEGEAMLGLGPVLYMSQVHMQSGSGEDRDERYLMLFQGLLIMLSSSSRMSGFIYQVRIRGTPQRFSCAYVCLLLPTGSSGERITFLCSSHQDYQEWLEHLTKGGSPVGTVSHPASPHGFGSPLSSRGPLEPPKIAKPWSLSCLRPAPPLKPSAALSYKERMSYILKDSSKSPRPITKFLQKRKTERKPSDDEFLLRKSTAALEEDAQILKVIEAYCTGAGFHQATTGQECVPQVLLPEEEKIIVEELRSNGQMTVEEKSLVDAVYALKDEVLELKKENKQMKQYLEEEQKSRRELERMVRKLAKQKNDSAHQSQSKDAAL
uniref:Rac/Cdc42 guanine nucleotide exchange factor 6 n=1 Tax=Paramormyrops kingsleyae TaxID=1676925 RepID=A0A3B3QTT9_9TELE